MTRYRYPFSVRALCFCLLIAAWPSGLVLATDGDGKRPARIDDWNEHERLGTPVLSSDGRSAAFIRQRPANAYRGNQLYTAEARMDVWVQLTPGQPARNLTNGASDQSGWWDPKWSPDGGRLAMLSTRTGEVTLWIWERSSNAIRQVSKAGIELFGSGSGCEWIDTSRLLCLAVPEDERATPIGSYGRASNIVNHLTAAWEKARRGEVTASVVNSVEFKQAPRRLVAINLDTREEQDVAMTVFGRASPTWWIAPGHRTVAFVDPAPSSDSLEDRFKMGFPATIGIRRLDGRPLQLSRALPANVLTATLAWSRDGRELAFFANGASPINPVLLYGDEGMKEIVRPAVTSLESPARLWRLNVDTGDLRQVDTADIDLGRELLPPSFQWMASRELLFNARRLAQRSDLQVPRPQWLVLSANGRVRPLVASATALPESLDAIDGGKAFVGIMDGDVWRIEPETGHATNLSLSFAPAVQQLSVFDAPGARSAIVLYAPLEAASARAHDAKARQADGADDSVEDRQIYVLDSSTLRVTALKQPDPAAELCAFSAEDVSGWFHTDTQEGTFLWRSSSRGALDVVGAVNAFYKGITPFEQRIIEYTSLNGETLKAKVTLPAGWTPDRRYPLIADSDIGYSAKLGPSLYRATPHAPFTDDPVAAAFAAAGYVYMFTSMPTITGMDEAGRANLLLFTNGLLPAVDKMVAIGLADPDRVFLYGASSFGYGVLGVITQTTRFRAAVAEAAWSDQITEALSIDMYDRYSDNPFEAIGAGPLYSSARESSTRGLLPVWRNADNYRRNSPLAYVDRVQTPLMIIKGEMDYLPMSNVENFFAALVLQRKPARLVRYWTEGHGNSKPANYRDAFQRIFAWFDAYGDISRDVTGRLVFDGERVRSRGGQPALDSNDFARFDFVVHTPETSRTSNP